MKKIFKTLLFSMILIFGLTSSVFAAGTNSSSCALQSSLQALGLSDCEIANVLEYLQEINMTQAQENSLIAYVNQAENIAGGRTDITVLSQAQKQQMRVIAQNAAAVVGLNVTFTTNSSGRQVLSLVKPNGGVILTLTSANARNVLWNTLRAAIRQGRIYSQLGSSGSGKVSPSKGGSSVCPSGSGSGSYSGKGGSGSASGTYIPKGGGSYCKTSTNTGNLLLAGFGLMAVSGVLIIKRRKALNA